jgi:hypothetical protein
MALLWFDGFDRYGDDSGYVDPRQIMLCRYQLAGNGNLNIAARPGRFEGYSISILWDASHWFQTPYLTTDKTLIVGFSMYQDESRNGIFMSLRTINNYYVGLQLQLNSDGSFSVLRGWTVLGTTAAGVLPLDEWKFIQLKVYCDGTSGTVELRVDNTTELTLTGINTQDDPSHDYYAAVRFQSITHIWEQSPRFDDFWVCDSTGGAPCNDFLGPGHMVQPLIPSSAGDSSDWDVTPGPDHYAAVDELVQDDTEYVESVTTDDLDLYHYDSPPTMNEIKGLQVHSEARVTGTIERTLKTVIKHDYITESEDAGQYVGNSNYLAFTRLMPLNPVTGVAWIRDDVDNLQAGVKVG